MVDPSLRELLEDVAGGATSPAAALERLRSLPFADLGFARVDHHRPLRQGFPEAVYAPGKTPAQCAAIVAELVNGPTAGPVLLTRADEATAASRPGRGPRRHLRPRRPPRDLAPPIPPDGRGRHRLRRHRRPPGGRGGGRHPRRPRLAPDAADRRRRGRHPPPAGRGARPPSGRRHPRRGRHGGGPGVGRRRPGVGADHRRADKRRLRLLPRGRDRPPGHAGQLRPRRGRHGHRQRLRRRLRRRPHPRRPGTPAP